jgi:two-component system, chemotaxis family, chemotaxis protein CheY
MAATVLIADDSLMVRQQVKRALEGAGFAVVEAVDGADALKKAQETTFALVVCDVNMPRMDGLEFLQCLSKEDVRKRPPVVMLTTEGQPELIKRAQSLGAKGWIIKPFKPELLVAAAKKIAGLA